MDYIAELTAIASDHGGIREAKVAAQRGISKAMLYKLCKDEKIHRIIKVNTFSIRYCPIKLRKISRMGFLDIFR